jgi:hypothetical protein
MFEHSRDLRDDHDGPLLSQRSQKRHLQGHQPASVTGEFGMIRGLWAQHALRRARYARGLATLPLALFSADYLSGKIVRSLWPNTESRLTVLRGDGSVGQRAIVLLPGFMMSGKCLGLTFRPYLAKSDTIIAVDYGRDCLSVSAIYEELRPVLDSLRPCGIRFFGASMGGLVAAGLVDCYGQSGMPFGRVSLFLDTAPSSRDEIRRPKWVFDLSRHYRGGMISSAFLAGFATLQRRPPIDTGVDITLLRRGQSTDISAGAFAATTQARFISSAAARNYPDLPRYIDVAVFLHGYCPELDPLVDVNQSIAKWRAVLPEMKEVGLASRFGRWHVPLLEQPRGTAEALLSSLEGLVGMGSDRSESAPSASGG